MSLPQTRATKSLSVCIWQERKDSNLQQMVLETTTLPIELRPYDMPQKERAEAGLEPATIGLANPWLYQLSYSAMRRHNDLS